MGKGTNISFGMHTNELQFSRNKIGGGGGRSEYMYLVQSS